MDRNNSKHFSRGNKMTIICTDAVKYMTNKSYTRGLRHGIALNVVLILIIGFVCFMGGRTYAYYQQIDEAAKVVKELRID